MTANHALSMVSMLLFILVINHYVYEHGHCC